MRKAIIWAVIFGVAIMFNLAGKANAAVPDFPQRTTIEKTFYQLDRVRDQYEAEGKRLEVVDGDDLTCEYIETRMERDTVLVEHAWSTSNGNGYGIFADGCITALNESVPKGKRVDSYYVYNPDTDYVDDVIAVIDCGKIR